MLSKYHLDHLLSWQMKNIYKPFPGDPPLDIFILTFRFPVKHQSLWQRLLGKEPIIIYELKIEEWKFPWNFLKNKKDPIIEGNTTTTYCRSEDSMEFLRILQEEDAKGKK